MAVTGAQMNQAAASSDPVDGHGVPKPQPAKQQPLLPAGSWQHTLLKGLAAYDYQNELSVPQFVNKTASVVF